MDLTETDRISYRQWCVTMVMTHEGNWHFADDITLKSDTLYNYIINGTVENNEQNKK